MAFCHNIMRVIQRIWPYMAILVMLSPAGMSAAQDSDILSRVQVLADRIEQADIQLPFDVNDIDSDTSLQTLKYYYFESLFLGEKETSSKILDQYEQKLTVGQPSESDKVLLQLLQDFHAVFDFDDVANTLPTVEATLQTYSDNGYWEVAFFARRLLSSFQMRKRLRILALQTAESAQSLIPDSLSEDAQRARINVSEFLAYLHNVQVNVDMGISATEKYLDLTNEANLPIDGIELLTNLMYPLSIRGEHKANLVIAEALLRLTETHTPSTPGLTELGVSKAYLGVQDYERAEAIARIGIAKANLSAVRDANVIVVAASLAGQGRTQEAQTLIDNDLPDTARSSNNLLRAQTLIAFKDGRIDEGLRLMEQRIDRTSRSILNIASNDASSIMASLENSRERQAEREDALKREAVLVQSRLQQQQKINTLLIVLVGLALIIVIAAMVFVRRLQKMTKALAIKSKEAQSADRMKTEFLGMVSHELRTPLNGIIGLADIMAQTGPTEQVKERAGIILSSGNELFNVIESVIDMSRIEGNKLELAKQATDIKGIVTETVRKWEPQARHKGVVLTSFVQNMDGAQFDIDPLRTQQCIDTLLSNAVKFTDKGRIHLHLTSETSPTDKAHKFTVVIADTGQGMSEDVQGKLFKPFLQADNYMTRKHGGSGLRLAIARAMARMMDGDITVNSREHRGSEFTFTFRATEEHEEGHEAGYEGEIADTSSTPLAAQTREPKALLSLNTHPHELIQLAVDNKGETIKETNLFKDRQADTDSSDNIFQKFVSPVKKLRR